MVFQEHIVCQKCKRKAHPEFATACKMSLTLDLGQVMQQETYCWNPLDQSITDVGLYSNLKIGHFGCQKLQNFWKIFSLSKSILIHTHNYMSLNFLGFTSLINLTRSYSFGQFENNFYFS